MRRNLLALGFLVLLISGVGAWHFLPPAPIWDPAPTTVVLETEQWGEIAIGSIPQARLWGNGRLMWCRYDHGRRSVYETFLTPADMHRFMTTLIADGFFVGSRWPKLDAPSFTTLMVRLRDTWQRQDIVPSNRMVNDVVTFVTTGAGHTGTLFTPTTGFLVVIPIEQTEFHDRSVPVHYQWSDETFGFSLDHLPAGDQTVLTGAALHYAWEIANDAFPFVQSHGKIYWLTIHIPGITI